MAIDSDSAYLVDQDGLGVTKDGSDDVAVLIQGGDSVPSHSAPLNTYFLRTNNEIYRQTADPSGSDWELALTDQHSGWYDVEHDQTVRVDCRKQMRISGILTLDGIIIIDGKLVHD